MSSRLPALRSIVWRRSCSPINAACTRSTSERSRCRLVIRPATCGSRRGRRRRRRPCSRRARRRAARGRGWRRGGPPASAAARSCRAGRHEHAVGAMPPSAACSRSSSRISPSAARPIGARRSSARGRGRHEARVERVGRWQGSRSTSRTFMLSPRSPSPASASATGSACAPWPRWCRGRPGRGHLGDRCVSWPTAPTSGPRSATVSRASMCEGSSSRESHSRISTHSSWRAA